MGKAADLKDAGPRYQLVAKPEQWRWSSVHEYGPAEMALPFDLPPPRIDRVRLPAEPRTRI
jgi:hypothetical protein